MIELCQTLHVPLAHMYSWMTFQKKKNMSPLEWVRVCEINYKKNINILQDKYLLIQKKKTNSPNVWKTLASQLKTNLCSVANILINWLKKEKNGWLSAHRHSRGQGTGCKCLQRAVSPLSPSPGTVAVRCRSTASPRVDATRGP